MDEGSACMHVCMVSRSAGQYAPANTHVQAEARFAGSLGL